LPAGILTRYGAQRQPELGEAHWEFKAKCPA
jgi:hypothetical protein